MKKIMFNDKYGLTAAVLNGRKTMTRRIIRAPRRTIEGKEVCGFAINKTSDGVPYEVWLTGPDEESLCQLLPTYKVGEEVAIAQAYNTLRWPALPGIDWKAITDEVTHSKGWTNKMFVKAEYMPHRIRITDIKIERLQDINGSDIKKEGVWLDEKIDRFMVGKKGFFLAKEAFAYLIDKVSGNGTWERNPWVFAYSFKLID